MLFLFGQCNRLIQVDGGVVVQIEGVQFQALVEFLDGGVQVVVFELSRCFFLEFGGLLDHFDCAHGGFAVGVQVQCLPTHVDARVLLATI